MSDTSDLTVGLAEALAEKLAQPMPDMAAADGWRSETWTKWGKIFESLDQTLAEGDTVDPASISRAMDFDGVYQGEILEAAARLSTQIRTTIDVEGG